MEFEAYRKALRQTRGKDLVEKYIKAAKEFERYLAGKTPAQTLEGATPKDFLAYEATFKDEEGARTMPYWLLFVLYRYLQKTDMTDAIMCACAQKSKSVELKQFSTLSLSLRNSLDRLGLRTNLDLLRAARTAADRDSLAKQTGTPVEEIVTLAQMSDLRRLLGPSRVQSLMEAGVYSVDKVASMSIDALHQCVANAHPGKRVNRRGCEYLPYRAQFYPTVIEGID